MPDQTADEPKEKNPTFQKNASLTEFTDNLSSFRWKKYVNTKLLGTIFGFLLLTGGVAAGVMVALQPQIFSQKAAVNYKVTTIPAGYNQCTGADRSYTGQQGFWCAGCGGFCLSGTYQGGGCNNAQQQVCGQAALIGFVNCICANRSADGTCSAWNAEDYGNAAAVKQCQTMCPSGGKTCSFGSGAYICSLYQSGACTSANGIPFKGNINGCFCGVVQIDTSTGHTTYRNQCGCSPVSTPLPSGSTPAPTPKPTVTPLPTATPTLIPIPTATPPVSCSKNLNIALVFDRSSTMTQKESDGRIKLEWAKDAARGFVQALKNTGTTTVSVSADSFGAQGNDGSGVLAPGYNSTLNIVMTNNFDNVITAVNNIKYSLPGTCIECGIRIGNGQLTNTSSRKVEILLSDGMANHNWDGTTGSEPRAKAINMADAGRAGGIEFRVLGYGLKSANQIDESTLMNIAGAPPFYQYKPNVSEWSNAFMSILGEVCNPFPVPIPKPIAILGASQDAFVSGESANKDKNYGSDTILQVDGSPVKIAYLQFDLTGFANKSVKQAILVLNTTDSSSANMNVKTTSNSWRESTITFSNRPAAGGVVSPFKGGIAGYPTLIDITSFVNANKGNIVSFAVDSTGSDGLNFASKETGINPRIVIY